MASKSFFPLKNSISLIRSSPKAELPTEEDYAPPPAPQSRELGPPPPGFARYADLERPGIGIGLPQSGLPGGAGAGSTNLQRRNLEEVTCFKVCLFSLDRHILNDLLSVR